VESAERGWGRRESIVGSSFLLFWRSQIIPIFLVLSFCDIFVFVFCPNKIVLIAI
jgi:hypothetical protein